jgi:phosphate transport system permease protein
MLSRWSDRLYAGFAWFVSLGVTSVVLILVGFLVGRGVDTLGTELLFGDTPWWSAVLGRQPVFDGLWPALIGTLFLVIGSSLIAIPLGTASGVYLAEYGKGPWSKVFSICADLLASVPSIIMGLVGFGLILLLRKTLFPHSNTCLLLSMVCLALLVLPYLIRTTETALSGLPEHVRLAGPTLGLTTWQSIWHVHLPAASRGIVSGVILAVARAAEDTAVILLTGVVANAGIPGNLTDKFEALPFEIFYLAAEHRTPAELDRAFAAALVLLALTATLFTLAFCMQRSLERRWTRRP